MINWQERAKEDRATAEHSSNKSFKRYMLESAKRCDERSKKQEIAAEV